MKVELESVSNVKKKLSVRIPEEDVRAEFDGAYDRLARKAQIPGFRKGKAPRGLLEKKFGGDVASEVYEALVRRTIVQALKDNDLDAVALPEITDPKHDQGQGFSYTASVEVKPSFEAKNYKSVKVKQAEAEPKNEQIDEVIGRIRDGHGVLKDREGAKKPVKGDYVSLLIQGTDDEGNVKNSGEEAKEQVYEIGGGVLHPEVEKAVLKLALNEAAPVTISGEEKDIHVRVTLKAVKEKILPPLDDDFAKSVGPFETLEALRARVTEDLKKELEQNGRAQMIEQILKHVVAENPIDLPPSLVDNETHQLMHGFWAQLERAGLKDIPEEYSEEKLHDKFKPDGERRVREQLLIEAIASKESISVPEEDVTQRMSEMAKAAKVPAAEFRAYYEKSHRIDSLRFQMLAHKTLDFLLSVASISK